MSSFLVRLVSIVCDPVYLACDYTGPYGTFAEPVTGSPLGVAGG